MHPTHGDFLICMAMHGSGHLIKEGLDNQAVVDPVGPVNGAHRVRKGASAGNRGEYSAGSNARHKCSRMAGS